MPGHGTIINGTAGQDDSFVAVDNNGGSANYKKGNQNALNCTGSAINSGDVVIVDYNEETGKLEVTRIGSRAEGTVSAEGTSVSITNSGDTSLSGVVNVSSSYGENDGWAGSTVSCGNVNGEAAYLGD